MVQAGSKQDFQGVLSPYCFWKQWLFFLIFRMMMSWLLFWQNPKSGVYVLEIQMGLFSFQFLDVQAWLAVR